MRGHELVLRQRVIAGRERFGELASFANRRASAGDPAVPLGWPRLMAGSSTGLGSRAGKGSDGGGTTATGVPAFPAIERDAGIPAGTNSPNTSSEASVALTTNASAVHERSAEIRHHLADLLAGKIHQHIAAKDQIHRVGVVRERGIDVLDEIQARERDHLPHRRQQREPSLRRPDEIRGRVSSGTPRTTIVHTRRPSPCANFGLMSGRENRDLPVIRSGKARRKAGSRRLSAGATARAPDAEPVSRGPLLAPAPGTPAMSASNVAGSRKYVSPMVRCAASASTCAGFSFASTSSRAHFSSFSKPSSAAAPPMPRSRSVQRSGGK